MECIPPPGANKRLIGPPGDPNVYDIEVRQCHHGDMPYVVSCWRPDAADLVALLNGGVIYLSVMGHTHPPLSIDCKAPWDE